MDIAEISGGEVDEDEDKDVFRLFFLLFRSIRFNPFGFECVSLYSFEFSQREIDGKGR